ncbi:UNVERIFIED_CONTAM: hypothetical protein Sradi_4384500 [Sesamum radiatum]|uniref:Uncharacterized protein n=1 Tax=Sesamum radiatum TaxID=300843 RepID=A0AAW2NPZ5_SESRA
MELRGGEEEVGGVQAEVQVRPCAATPPARGRPQAGGASQCEALAVWAAFPPLVHVSSPHLEHSVPQSCCRQDDVLKYMEGYSPNHIAIILSLLEYLPSDSGDYLDDSNDYDLDETRGDGSHFDDHVEEKVLGSEGEEAVCDDDQEETDVSNVS